MVPWQFIDSAPVPDSDQELGLYRRGDEFSIRVAGCELMNSRLHGSEDVLAEYACERIAAHPSARILIGGLGMGFTLAAALRRLGPAARLVVAELVPKVVVWNRNQLAFLAGQPLLDQRVTVQTTDVSILIREGRRAWDAIVLDVDNGPDGLTRKENCNLYTLTGLKATFAALRPGGVLAVWSAAADQDFTKRLRQAGFRVDEVGVELGAHEGAAIPFGSLNVILYRAGSHYYCLPCMGYTRFEFPF